jgi:hypothetical protein
MAHPWRYEVRTTLKKLISLGLVTQNAQSLPAAPCSPRRMGPGQLGAALVAIRPSSPAWGPDLRRPKLERHLLTIRTTTEGTLDHLTARNLAGCCTRNLHLLMQLLRLRKQNSREVAAWRMLCWN